ncbi:MAG: hypothetical protein ACE5SW_05615, partial [Nitrososphaeraceae archaeon]
MSKNNFPYIMSIIILFAFATFIPTIYPFQTNNNEFPVIQQISPQENSNFGYIILLTEIINSNNNDIQQPSDLTINVMGTDDNQVPSSFKPVP